MKQNFLSQSNQRSRFSWVKLSVAIFLCVLVFPLFFSNVRAVKAFFSSIKDLRKTEANLQSLSSRKNVLEKESNFYKSNFGIEKEIREKFPVAKDGEEVIIFTEPDNINEIEGVMGEEGFWFKIKSKLGF